MKYLTVSEDGVITTLDEEIVQNAIKNGNIESSYYAYIIRFNGVTFESLNYKTLEWEVVEHSEEF